MIEEKPTIKEMTFVGLDVVVKIGLERILITVCNYLEVSVEDVKSGKRQREVCTARHLYCFLSTKAFGGYTLVRIGKEIGRDHASVLHAKRKILNYLEWDSQTNKIVKDLMVELGRFSSNDVDNNTITPSHVGYYKGAERKRALKLYCENHDPVIISNQLIK